MAAIIINALATHDQRAFLPAPVVLSDPHTDQADVDQADVGLQESMLQLLPADGDDARTYDEVRQLLLQGHIVQLDDRQLMHVYLQGWRWVHDSRRAFPRHMDTARIETALIRMCLQDMASPLAQSFRSLVMTDESIEWVRKILYIAYKNRNMSPLVGGLDSVVLQPRQA